MYYIMDRIEGETAVLEGEDGSSRNMPLWELPQGIREGDILFEADNLWRKDEDATAARRTALQKKADKLYI